MRICLRRAAFMVSYNDSRPHEFPFNTSQVPCVLPNPPYSHPLELASNSATPAAHPIVLVLNKSIIPGKLAVGHTRQPVTSLSPAGFHTAGTLISEATVSLDDGGQALQISGNNSQYGDQFSSPPIAVRKDTDYVLAIPVHLLNADMAIKVTSVDRRRILAITSVAEAEQEASSAADDRAGESPHRQMAVIQMPFATRDKTEVSVVVSNNAATPTPPSMELGQAEFFEIGPTPYSWTRYPRAVIAGIQREYGTLLMRTLIILGIALLLLARRARATLILLAVPVYYVCAQAPLHTEYRYILPIHYFLFVFAGVTVFCMALTATKIARLMTGWIGYKLQTR